MVGGYFKWGWKLKDEEEAPGGGGKTGSRVRKKDDP